ncbi:MAG: hypothetical protein GX323_01715 [Clostridiales bacterium]|nr:hypothetical protein [Clostridiales bacterium]
MSNMRGKNKNRQEYQNSKNAGQASIARAKVKRSRKVGIILANIQLIITFVFLGLLIMLNVLPFKYLIALVVVLLFFVGYAFLSQLTRHYRKLGKVLSVIISIVLVFGCNYLVQTRSMISDISGKNTKKDEMSIVVLKEDPADSINDTIDYMYGINEIIDREKSNEVIDSINKELDTKLKIQVYQGYDALVDALYSGDSQVIIINEAYREIIHETYPDFDERTRTVGNYDVETEIEPPKNDKVDLTEEPFHVFISGIDTAGSISKTSRSDVNIIATINPNTHQVLLTTTPRDYYIPFPNSNGQRDKLTHAGIYGVDISIGALEALYGIDIDYYVRVNFTTLIDLVDALGGISAYSEYTFNAGGYSFKKGYNDMDGKKALAFSRERKSFGAGDMQRGRNQMEVIKGIINKAISPSIIVNYTSVMNSIAGSFETNMSNDNITRLIKMQIDEMASWDIISNNVIGTPSSQVTFTQKRKASVVLPNEESVSEAKEKINAVINGMQITQE